MVKKTSLKKPVEAQPPKPPPLPKQEARLHGWAKPQAKGRSPQSGNGTEPLPKNLTHETSVQPFCEEAELLMLDLRPPKVDCAEMYLGDDKGAAGK